MNFFEAPTSITMLVYYLLEYTSVSGDLRRHDSISKHRNQAIVGCTEGTPSKSSEGRGWA